jgi:hypothetical protein
MRQAARSRIDHTHSLGEFAGGYTRALPAASLPKTKRLPHGTLIAVPCLDCPVPAGTACLTTNTHTSRRRMAIRRYNEENAR